MLIFILLTKIISVSLLLMLCPAGFCATADEVKQAIIKQSTEMGVDPAIMLSLAKAESGFRQEAKGASGTVGVFQLMPSTARGLGFDPYKLEDNIKCGITYYRNLYKIFGSTEMALAAYNSGPYAVKSCKCVPARSQAFVNRVISNSKYYKTN